MFNYISDVDFIDIKNRRSYMNDRQERLVRMYEMNIGRKNLEREFGLSWHTIRKNLVLLGVKIRQKGRPKGWIKKI